jgi:hypothetical protein
MSQSGHARDACDAVARAGEAHRSRRARRDKRDRRRLDSSRDDDDDDDDEIHARQVADCGRMWRTAKVVVIDVDVDIVGGDARRAARRGGRRSDARARRVAHGPLARARRSRRHVGRRRTPRFFFVRFGLFRLVVGWFSVADSLRAAQNVVGAHAYVSVARAALLTDNNDDDDDDDIGDEFVFRANRAARVDANAAPMTRTAVDWRGVAG